MEINFDDKAFWRKFAVCIAAFGGITVILRGLFSVCMFIALIYFFNLIFNHIHQSHVEFEKNFKASQEEFDKRSKASHEDFERKWNEHDRYFKERVNNFEAHRKEMRGSFFHEKQNVNTLQKQDPAEVQG